MSEKKGVQTKIEQILNEAFEPDILIVENQSALHHGHTGDDGSGESHFEIRITSEKFKGKSRVECHRMVFSKLQESLEALPHAVSLVISHG